MDAARPNSVLRIGFCLLAVAMGLACSPRTIAQQVEAESLPQPLVQLIAKPAIGRQPLRVGFVAEVRPDVDPQSLSYTWRLRRAGDSRQQMFATTQRAELVFSRPGVFEVELIVTDAGGEAMRSCAPILVGNEEAEIRFQQPESGDLIDVEEPIAYRLYVNDAEDGTSDYDEAEAANSKEIDPYVGQRTLTTLTIHSPSVNRAESPPATPAGKMVSSGWDLIRQSDCLTCHAIDRPRVGPSFLEIAEKYRTDDAAIARAIDKVIRGTQGGAIAGTWGKIPMSSHPQLSLADARQMVEWIFALKTNTAPRVYSGLSGEIVLESGLLPSAGKVTLAASYLDLGADGAIPIATTAELTLRVRQQNALLADLIQGPRIVTNESHPDQSWLEAVGNQQHWIAFERLPISQVGGIAVQVSSDQPHSRIRVHLDQTDGPLLGSIPIPNQAGEPKWEHRELRWSLAELQQHSAQFAQQKFRSLVLCFENEVVPNAVLRLQTVRFLKPAEENSTAIAN